MLTGELRSKIDGVWNAFWAGGIANPLEVIEQITYLLFMRGLDEAHTREEANRLGKPIGRRIFPEGKDDIGKAGGVAYEDMRWSRLKNRDPGTMFEIVSEHVFPFLRNMAEIGSAHATHMKGARFTIPTPALLAKVVDLLADIPMEDRDTKGDPSHDFARLREAGVTIVSCFVTNEDVAEARTLIGLPDPGWSNGTRLMWEIASALDFTTPFAHHLVENGWNLKEGSKLFVQANHSEVLKEFVSAVAVQSESGAAALGPKGR
jgi:hypothetical protein